MSQKISRVAFFFGLSTRTYPILHTMPFGLNVIKMLDQQGYKIDVYLTEFKNHTLEQSFSSNVKIHFLDSKLLWLRPGKINYYLIHAYFKLIILSKLTRKYSFLIGSGSIGISLASVLSKYNKGSRLIYLNDEFPDSGSIEIWRIAEKIAALNSDYVCTPDDCRFLPLCEQIAGLNMKKNFNFSNAPLLKDLENLPNIDWHSYFGLSKEKKMFISAGGIGDVYQLTELLMSVKDWPEDCVLILKGKTKIQMNLRSFDHLESIEKVIWNSDNFSPEKLHSLINYCTASICLYRNIDDNILSMGKSSGKLMRSLALGKPVIASAFDSLSFVEELGIGKLVKHPSEIPNVIKYILNNEEQLKQACKSNYSEISFEKGWNSFSNELRI
jgi:glycosyltransferase involved in cell wall biosynthesis